MREKKKKFEIAANEMLQARTNGTHASITLSLEHMFPKSNKNYHCKH